MAVLASEFCDFGASRLRVFSALRRRARDRCVCVLCVRRRDGVVSMFVGGSRPVYCSAVVTVGVVVRGIGGLDFALCAFVCCRVCGVGVFVGLGLLGEFVGRVCLEVCLESLLGEFVGRVCWGSL